MKRIDKLLISFIFRYFAGKDDSDFVLWLIYSCDGGTDESTFRNDTSTSL